MKKRKFFSLFAILFVAVFALSCCFFVACGNKDENDTETDIEQDDGKKEDESGSDDGDGKFGEGGTTEDGESGDGSGSGSGNTGSDSGSGNEKDYSDVEFAELVSVDFNDDTTYSSWIQAVDGNNDGKKEISDGTYTDGILTFDCTGASGNAKVLPLNDGTEVLATGSNSAYIKIDLSEYAGNPAKIEVKMSSNVGESSKEERSLMLTTKSSVHAVGADGVIASVSSEYQEDIQTLSEIVEIGDSTPILYLTCTKNICIFSFTVYVPTEALADEANRTTAADARVELPNNATDASYMTIGSIGYSNSEDLAISQTYGISKVNYKVTGTASFFENQDAADAFWYGDSETHDEHIALEGDAYVILKIKAVEGETVTYSATDGKEHVLTYSQAESDGYHYIIIRLTGTIDTEEIEVTTKEYTVTANEESITHVVDLSDIDTTEPGEEIELDKVAVLDFADTTLWTTGNLIGSGTHNTANEGEADNWVADDNFECPIALEYNVSGLAEKETGFMLERCGSNGKYTAIASKNSSTYSGNVNVLQFQGQAKVSDDNVVNTISYELNGGTYAIKLSYFTDSGTSKSGRYGSVFTYETDGESEESAWKDITEECGSAYQTQDNNSAVITRTVEITLYDKTTIYIGSGNSGLYFTFIGIYTASVEA